MLNRFLRMLGFSEDAEHDALTITLMLIAFLLLVGVIVFHETEGLSRFDSFYFAVASISTIGYGDIVPTTTASKIVIMIYSLTGVPLFIYTAGLLVEVRIRDVVGGYIHEQEEHLEDIEEDLEKVEKALKKQRKENKSLKKSKKKKSIRKKLVA